MDAGRPRAVREGGCPYPQRRSRFGCRNCKLRKLKCDEAKPQCKRCSSFGVLCNFTTNVPDLQPAAADKGQPLVVRQIAKPQAPFTNSVWTSDKYSFFLLNAKCQNFVTRYYGRGLAVQNDPSMVHVNRKLLELAFSCPFLMHASVGVALTYDRYLNGSLGCRRTPEECYHWYQSTILLKKRLREPIEAKDKDPIWGTAAALALLSFSFPDGSTPEETWPVKSSGSSDLDWLRMSKSKMSLWHIVNPLRPGSLFSVMAATFADMYSPLPDEGIDGIPEQLAVACKLKESSTVGSNPYFHAAHAVSQILHIPDSALTTGQTQTFMWTIQGSFERLLTRKDPVALLLLYLWYHKTSRSIWWIELRARVECPAICLYLRQHHGTNDAIQAFLPGGMLAEGVSGKFRSLAPPSYVWRRDGMTES